MHDRAAEVPQEATAGANPQEAIAGGEPGPAVVLGLALFSAAVTRRFSPLPCLAAYARAAADRQHLVPVRLVLKGEAAPSPLPQVVVVVEAETAPAALLLASPSGCEGGRGASPSGCSGETSRHAPTAGGRDGGGTSRHAPSSGGGYGGGTSRNSPSAGGALWRAAREGSIRACCLPAELCGEQPEREASGPAVSLLSSVESSQRGKHRSNKDVTGLYSLVSEVCHVTMEGRRSAVQLQHSSPAESNQRGKHQGLLSPC
ncbi:UNVERIFIED_CONTAM: hypothetical protein FKN15_052445 [Acipenser sinensis]